MVDMIIIAVIFIIVFLAVRTMIKDKARKISGCGCGCSNCAMAGKCGGTTQEEQASKDKDKTK